MGETERCLPPGVKGGNTRQREDLKSGRRNLCVKGGLHHIYCSTNGWARQWRAANFYAFCTLPAKMLALMFA
jgi:hypothetical protein